MTTAVLPECPRPQRKGATFDAQGKITLRYSAFVARLFPAGTRRRRLLDILVKGSLILIHEGPREFWKRASLRLVAMSELLPRRYPLFQTLTWVSIREQPFVFSGDLHIRFRCSMDDLCEIQLLTGEDRRPERHIEAALRENAFDGPVVRTIVARGGQIRSQDYTRLRFAPVAGSRGKVYVLQIKSSASNFNLCYQSQTVATEIDVLDALGQLLAMGLWIRAFSRQRFRSRYSAWIAKYEPNAEELGRMREAGKGFSYQPTISVVMPTFNTPLRLLRDAIGAVQGQIYPHWELCVADASLASPRVRCALAEYAAADPRIKVKELPKNLGIAGNSQQAVELATGDFVGFLDHDDMLAPFALFEIAKCLNEDNTTDFFYSDEDQLTDNGRRRFNPHFKPEWSPDTILSYNYACHFAVVRRTVLAAIGGFREGFDGSQDYDLILRIAQRTAKIRRIARALYHWRAVGSSTANSDTAKPYAYTAAKRAISSYLEAKSLEGEVLDASFVGSYRVKYRVHENQKVAIIIPTRDQAELLSQCVTSLLSRTDYKSLEVLIVNNNSERPATFELFRQLATDPRVRILDYDRPFNFSAINNFGAASTDARHLLFLNNDTEIIEKDWLSAMVEFSQRRDVGGVGAKLFYSDDTIQHAGVIVGIAGLAGHAHKHAQAWDRGYMGRAKIIQNVSAVTAACMMTRKDVFEEVGRFDENLPVAFNDVDLCLRIRRHGYLIVFTPYSQLYHHESRSRGYDTTPENAARLLRETLVMRERWKAELAAGDPYYNPNLTHETEDLAIRT